MTEIIPFRGIMYNPAGVSLQKVLAPPMRTLTHRRLPESSEQHPQNVTRMLYPQGDGPPEESAGIIRSWLAQGVLVKEKTPVIYIVEQVFRAAEGDLRRRRGFIALWKFVDHPQSNPPTSTRRSKWIRETGIWPSPLFLLYEDPTRRIDRHLSYAARSVPFCDVMVDDVRTIVWKLHDGGAIAGIVREMKEKRVCISGDGLDILSLSASRTIQPDSEADEPYNYVPTMFVNTADPGLVSVPLHRLWTVHREFSSDDIIRRLEEQCSLTVCEEKNALERRLAEHGVHAAGLILPGESKYFLAILKDAVEPENFEGLSPTRYALTVLDDAIRAALGSVTGVEAVVEVRYTNALEEVWSTLESGGAHLAGLANQTPMDVVVTAMSAGLPVPMGVLDHYPHLPLGLVLHIFRE